MKEINVSYVRSLYSYVIVILWNVSYLHGSLYGHIKDEVFIIVLSATHYKGKDQNKAH